jgi:hypothetical protein
MNEEMTRSTGANRGGCLVALALILLPGVVAMVWSGPLPSEELPYALLYGLLLAIPFGYLALDGTRDWRPWFVAIVFTALFWSAFIGSAIIGTRDQSGVNFGMGMVMLASPFVTTLAAWLSNRRR